MATPVDKNIDIEWMSVEITPSGLNEGVDERLLPPGQLVKCINGDFSANAGSVKFRIGTIGKITENTNGNFRDEKLARNGKSIFKVCLNYGEGINGRADPKLQIADVENAAWRDLDFFPVATVERTPLQANLAIEYASDMTVANGYAVYILADNPSIDGYGVDTIRIRVIELISGALVKDEVFTGTAVWVKAATSDFCALVTYSDGLGRIRGRVVDCGSEPTIGAPVVLVDNEYNGNNTEDWITPYKTDGIVVDNVRNRHDVCGRKNNIGWILFYCNEELEAKAAYFESSALTETWIEDVDRADTDGRAFDSLSCVTKIVDEVEYAVFNYYYPGSQDSSPGENTDYAWRYAIMEIDDVGMVVFPTDWYSVSNEINSGEAYGELRCSGIASAPDDSEIIYLFHSQAANYNAQGTRLMSELDKRPIMRWAPITIAGGSPIFIGRMRGVTLWGKPWVEATDKNQGGAELPAYPAWYVWTKTHGKAGSPYSSLGGQFAARDGTDGDYEPLRSETLCLLKGRADIPFLEATACGEIAGYNARGKPNSNNQPYTTSPDSTGAYYMTVPVRFIRTESKTNIQTLKTRFDHPGRGKSVVFGKATYFTGGVVTLFDGEKLIECGFAIPPLAQALDETGPHPGAGNWDSEYYNPEATSVNYTFLYEYVCPSGERMLSSKSDFIFHPALGSTNKLEINGESDELDLGIEPYTVGRIHTRISDRGLANRVVAVPYRNSTPDGDVQQRVARFDALPSQGFTSWGFFAFENVEYDYKTWTDRGYPYDNRIESHEPIYTTVEQENVMPYGGATAICVHQDRLWLAGGEDVEVLWYSKPRADDRVAEFTLAQQIRIPGENVVALASSSNALIAFCERGIYAIFGEGPDATGAGPTFSLPQVVSNSVGCKSVNSVVSTPVGIFFQSHRGMYLLNGAHQLQYIGAPVEDTLDGYFLVKDAKVFELNNQVRFVCSALDGGRWSPELIPGAVLVYDYVHNKWAQWMYGLDGYAPNALELDEDGNPALLAYDGKLYVDNLLTTTDYLDSSGETYNMILETGWLSFGKLLGYKKIGKLQLLIEKFATHDLTVEIMYRYKETVVQTKTFTQAETALMSEAEWIKIALVDPEAPSVKIRIIANAPIALQAIGFEVGLKPGLQRLAASSSK